MYTLKDKILVESYFSTDDYEYLLVFKEGGGAIKTYHLSSPRVGEEIYIKQDEYMSDQEVAEFLEKWIKSSYLSLKYFFSDKRISLWRDLQRRMKTGRAEMFLPWIVVDLQTDTSHNPAVIVLFRKEEIKDFPPQNFVVFDYGGGLVR